MRYNPVWNTTETMTSKQMQKQKQWFDWFEVDWDDNNGNVYTVPATLDLIYGGGQILYSDQSTDLLASVRSLCSIKSLKQHDCILFSHGDFLNRDW
jgi:hypothetical protein